MLRPTSECEYDPDHLYHDHREADELRADVELLTRNRDAARMIIGPLSERPDLVDACEDVVREADELRAEIERLRAALREIYGHATADNDGQPCCDTVVMLAKAALHPTPSTKSSKGKGSANPRQLASD